MDGQRFDGLTRASGRAITATASNDDTDDTSDIPAPQTVRRQR